jgi:hypothetical protein
MTQNFRRTAMAMTCATTLFLSALPSFAAITGHRELEELVRIELRELGITTDRLDQLTLAQIAELSNITESTGTAADRKAEAESVLAQATNPGVGSLRHGGLVELEALLRNDLRSVGIVLPSREELTFAQVAELTGIFDSTDDSDADKTQAAKQVLGIN